MGRPSKITPERLARIAEVVEARRTATSSTQVELYTELGISKRALEWAMQQLISGTPLPLRRSATAYRGVRITSRSAVTPAMVDRIIEWLATPKPPTNIELAAEFGVTTRAVRCAIQRLKLERLARLAERARRLRSAAAATTGAPDPQSRSAAK
jgi:biotin operon repressor